MNKRKSCSNCALAQYVARIDWHNRNMNEQFRTVAEVAEMLGVSKDTVRRLLADEPGVIDLGRREATSGKRRYRLLRIPSNVINPGLEQQECEMKAIKSAMEILIMGGTSNSMEISSSQLGIALADRHRLCTA
jgi:hypothetical protein